MLSKEQYLQETLGEAVRSRRTALGLSQLEVARSAGFHRSMISDLERGVNNISLITLLRIAQTLSVAPSRLLKMAESIQKKSQQRSEH